MGDEIDANFVMLTLGNDHVGVLLGWLDELHVHGMDGRQVLLEDGFDGSSRFTDVSAQATNEALVRVGVDEDFDAH